MLGTLQPRAFGFLDCLVSVSNLYVRGKTINAVLAVCTLTYKVFDQHSQTADHHQLGCNYPLGLLQMMKHFH